MLSAGLLSTTGALTGCASHRRLDESQSIKMAKLQKRLRKANAKIETLREKNLILSERVKTAEDSSDRAPSVGTDAFDTLEAFKPGTQLDVAISPTLPGVGAKSMKAGREPVSLGPARERRRAVIPAGLPTRLPAKGAQAAPPSARESASGEQADRLLARTVTDLLKSGDDLEAERTARLLDKSYPDSELIAETRFQLGLYFFRKKNLPESDRQFQATMKAPRAHVRARAGAALMRGIIARRVAATPNAKAAQSNLQLAKKSFEYVRHQFPGSPEARRAARELKTMKVTSASAAVRTK